MTQKRILHISLKPSRRPIDVHTQIDESFSSMAKHLSSLEERLSSLERHLSSHDGGRSALDGLSSQMAELSRQLPYMSLMQNEFLSRLLQVRDQHRNVFPKYRNINQGKDVVLIATGPSLQHFRPIEGAVYVGVNRAYEYQQVKFDYLFMQDFSSDRRDYIEEFINYDAVKFLGYLAYHLVPQCIVPAKYDGRAGVERYYASHPYEKQSFSYDLSTSPLGDAYSVVFPAMQFILWTNPKTIYLVGCDSSNAGYYNTKPGNNVLMVNEVVSGWHRMKEFAAAYYPDTKIVSINPIGLKGIFEDIETRS